MGILCHVLLLARYCHSLSHAMILTATDLPLHVASYTRPKPPTPIRWPSFGAISASKSMRRLTWVQRMQRTAQPTEWDFKRHTEHAHVAGWLHHVGGRGSWHRAQNGAPVHYQVEDCKPAHYQIKLKTTYRPPGTNSTHHVSARRRAHDDRG